MYINCKEITQTIDNYFLNYYMEESQLMDSKLIDEINYSYMGTQPGYTLDNRPMTYTFQYIHVYDDTKVVRMLGHIGIEYVTMTEDDRELYTLKSIRIVSIDGLNESIEGLHRISKEIQEEIHSLYYDLKTICSYAIG